MTDSEHLRAWLFTHKAGLSIRNAANALTINYKNLIDWINQADHRGKPRGLPAKHLQPLVNYFKTFGYVPGEELSKKT